MFNFNHFRLAWFSKDNLKHQKLKKQLQEFQTYVHSYREDYETRRQAGHFLVKDGDVSINYVSNPYIERY